MAASFQEILSSRLYKFIVGEKIDGSPTEFFVHEKAITQLSKPLGKLLEDSLTQPGCMIWDDMSKETFGQLVQFAYTGDYSLAKMKKRKSHTKAMPSNAIPEVYAIPAEYAPPEEYATIPEEFLRAEDDPIPISKKKKKGVKTSFDSWGFTLVPGSSLPQQDECVSHYPRMDTAGFQSLLFPLPAPRNNYESTCEPAEEFDEDKSYSNAFLSHASLYTLSNVRHIDSLKALALYKLHKTLRVFQLRIGNAEDVVDLVRYVYSGKGGEGQSGKEIGPLRTLVCQYLAVNALLLSWVDGFMELLAEGGQLVIDFFKFEVQNRG